VAGPHRRAADRLSDRDGAANTSRWRAADLLIGRDGAHDDADGGASRRWLAAELLEGRDGPGWATGAGRADLRRAAGETRWRAADLLDRRSDAGDRVTGTRWRAAELLGRSDDGTHDAPPRHGGEDRRTVPPPRVPPTRWAWPKAEPELPPALVPARRTADDDRRSMWSAADLLDEGKHAGGRRRKPEPARHSAPAEEAGRHRPPPQ
jgi:hypothetical protein